MKTFLLILLALGIAFGLGVYGPKILDSITGGSSPSLPKPAAFKFNAPRF